MIDNMIPTSKEQFKILLEEKIPLTYQYTVYARDSFKKYMKLIRKHKKIPKTKSDALDIYYKYLRSL